MGRRPGNRNSLNSSVVTVTNNSLVEDTTTLADIEYADIVKRFIRAKEESKTKLLATNETKCIQEKIDDLLDSKEAEASFALITGPSGTGKTFSVMKIVDLYKSQLSFFFLDACWLMQKKFGPLSEGIELLFNEAVKKAPSVIFIDEIDLICAKGRSSGEPNKILHIISWQIKELKSTEAKVLVLAATNKNEVIDPELTKAGWFNREIKFKLPTRENRVDILKEFFIEGNVEKIADATHCYSYNDLKELGKIAKKHLDQDKKLTFESFKLALSLYEPVTTKSITTPCLPVRWTDIGGLEHVKRELQKSVMGPLIQRDKFEKLGIRPKKGALLYGPSGCSKTMLARALATESGFNFISIKGPELFSKYVGDSEAAVRRLYSNARSIAPCLIFFDEIDALASQRSSNGESQNSVGDKIVTQLLTVIDGVDPLHNVFTLAATNRPDRLDTPLLRPGRLYPAIYIPLPSEKDRKEIFKVHMRRMCLKSEEINEQAVEDLAGLTNYYSGAEIEEVCCVAADLSLDDDQDTDCTEIKHFYKALEKVKPRTNLEHLKAYEKFRDRDCQKEVPRKKKTLIRRMTKLVMR